MNAARIACVVLASGLSERFGDADKLSADLCGQPVLSYVLDTANDVGFGEIFCVSRAGEIDGFTSVENEFPEYGQGHALRLGLQAARSAGWNMCVVMLGDMPLVTSSYVKTLIVKNQSDVCVVSVNDSIKMPPAIFGSRAMDIILSQESSAGARELFDLLSPATLQLDADAARDVDTPADLARVAGMMKARKI